MDASKNASPEAVLVQEAFTNTVEISQLRKQKGPDAAEIASYPSWHDRGQHVGPSEGFIKLFNKDGKGIAAQWSMDTKVWIEVGEVTGSSGAKESIDGVEYDMVLPVEMETTQGLHTFQLGYNNGENPFVAAQRFLDTNGIDQSYHSQIADWIIARQGQSSQPTIDMSGGSSTGDNTTGIFTYVCTHKYALIHIHSYILIHTHTYSYMLIHTYTYSYILIHAHVYIFMRTYMFARRLCCKLLICYT